MPGERLYRDNCPECAVQDNKSSNQTRKQRVDRTMTLMHVEDVVYEELFRTRVEFAGLVKDLGDTEFADPASQRTLKQALREKGGELLGLGKAMDVISLMQDPHNEVDLVDPKKVLGPITLVPHETVEQALSRTGRSSIGNAILFNRASAAYMTAFKAEGAERF